MTTAEEFLPGLVDLWQGLLGQPADQDTDFFYAGGHSLLAVQLLQKSRAAYNLHIPFDALISAPTPRLFAERLAGLQAGQA